MPLGRHKKPFSTKQKKEQLKAKREQKRNRNDDDTDSNDSSTESPAVESGVTPGTASGISTTTLVAATETKQRGSIAAKHINQQPVKVTGAHRDHNPNRFNLQFARGNPEELKRLKKDAAKPLCARTELDVELNMDGVYRPDSSLDMPTRPAWTYEMTKLQIEQQEHRYFNNYVERIFAHFKSTELSYFELNLETWRQLWRVLEISDIVLLIVDIRFPALHFSPAFYRYCTNTLHKDVILVLNKIDLVPPSVAVAWKRYFEERFPQLHVLLFSSSKQIRHRQRRQADADSGTHHEPTKQELNDEALLVKALAAEIYTARAHRQLYECVQRIVAKNQADIDLTSWNRLVGGSGSGGVDGEAAESVAGRQKTQLPPPLDDDAKHMEELFQGTETRKRFDNGFVTIGCCGFPNVGKSSLLNSLNGKKVVSVSRTPGHTKHLQTIFLTKTVRLCDCPGLVFPSLIEKPLQILAGIYPIAQLQEPYSAIRYIAERVPLISALKLRHPNASGATNTDEVSVDDWSPLDVCEAWAIKRGYLTAKASRPDVYRAANELLRMSLDGRICLSLRPPGYSAARQLWDADAETVQLSDIVNSVEQLAKNRQQEQHRHQQAHSDQDDDDEEEDEDEDEEEELLNTNDMYKCFRDELEENESKESTSD